MKPNRAVNACGNAKYNPEIPHIRTKRKPQNPSALCRSQLNRAKSDLQFTVKARRQLLIPGHQITAPLKHNKITEIAPMPFTKRPFLPNNRFSCRSTIHSTEETKEG